MESCLANIQSFLEMFSVIRASHIWHEKTNGLCTVSSWILYCVFHIYHKNITNICWNIPNWERRTYYWANCLLMNGCCSWGNYFCSPCIFFRIISICNANANQLRSFLQKEQSVPLLWPNFFFFFCEGLQANVEEKRVKGSLIDGRKT